MVIVKSHHYGLNDNRWQDLWYAGQRAMSIPLRNTLSKCIFVHIKQTNICLTCSITWFQISIPFLVFPLIHFCVQIKLSCWVWCFKLSMKWVGPSVVSKSFFIKNRHIGSPLFTVFCDTGTIVQKSAGHQIYLRKLSLVFLNWFKFAVTVRWNGSWLLVKPL